jgi:hypothetical protein
MLRPSGSPWNERHRTGAVRGSGLIPQDHTSPVPVLDIGGAANTFVRYRHGFGWKFDSIDTNAHRMWETNMTPIRVAGQAVSSALHGGKRSTIGQFGPPQMAMLEWSGYRWSCHAISVIWDMPTTGHSVASQRSLPVIDGRPVACDAGFPAADSLTPHEARILRILALAIRSNIQKVHRPCVPQ